MLDIEVVDDYIIRMHQQMNIDKGATTAKKKINKSLCIRMLRHFCQNL